MNKKNRKNYCVILSICVAAIVLLFDIFFIALPDKDFSEAENRNLQKFPVLSFSTITKGRFEKQFDNYVADQFPARNTWVLAQTTIERLLGKTMSNNIFLGKDGYVIKNFEYPTDEQYEEKLLSYQEIASANHDKNVYVMAVPSAVSVLEDKLPAFSKGRISGDENEYIDRLYKDLKSMGIKTVDVREALNDMAEKGEQVYYRTDHHWTTDAAYAAYNVFLSNTSIPPAAVSYERMPITGEFKGTLTASSGLRTSETDTIYAFMPVEEEVNDYVFTNVDTGEKRASVYDTSFLETRDKYGVFFGGNHGIVSIKTSSDSERTILVIKDSYANCFVPFMIADFKKIVMVDPRYNLRDINTIIEEENVTDILFLNSVNA